MMIRMLLRQLCDDKFTEPKYAETCRTLLTLISFSECNTDQEAVGLMIGVITAQREEIEALQPAKV